ncbi:acyltransferase [Halosquirtibacter xylanolyticus]|uniref:acyltransferase family protein n=1 Tax=Halosquirtibacter xylanolyticus TaxID=3374599 RepID=UPI003749FD4B|nr:acyltransferase [Prolixibacteraceae bacterium]
MEKKHSTNGIDLLKFILSLLVVLIHCNPIKNDNCYKFLIEGIIRIAVPSFFLINGLLLKEQYLLNKSLYLKKNIKIYLFWSLLYFPFYYHTSISTYCLNFVMGYGHLWYIGAMILGVFLFSFIYKSRLNNVLLYIFIYAVACFSFYYIQIISEDIDHNIVAKILKLPKYLIRNGFWDALPFIGIGYMIKRKRFTIKQSYNLVLFLLSITALLFESYVLRIKFFNIYESTEGADFMFMLLPTSVFLLLYFKDHIKLGINSILFRRLSALVFFIHYGVNQILMEISQYGAVERTFITIAITMVISLIVIYIQDTIHESKRCTKPV